MADEEPAKLERTVSDAMSGMSFDRNVAEWAEYTEVELQRHYERFKEYDLDEAGFITPVNLQAIMEAMDITVTEEQVTSMIAECAILSGHENDGRLSFRDFMKCMDYEAKKTAHNERVDSVIEAMEAGVEEQPAAEAAASISEATEPEPEVPMMRMRGSSFAVMDTLASNRINAFQQVIKDAKKKEHQIPATPAAARFQNKLSKFKRIEDGKGPPKRNNDGLQQAAIKGKLAAFESAQKSAEDPVAFKREWKSVSQGKWAEKLTKAPGGDAGGAPPPKRNIADLP